MKKILGIVILLALVGSICSAQEAAKPSDAASAAKTVIGKVTSVTVADPAKGIANGAVSIVDSTGKAITFTVGSAVKVLDAASNIIPLNQLKAGNNVKIKESGAAAEGAQAQSITLLK